MDRARGRRLGRARHLLSEAALLSWRVTRGNLTRGVKARLRRLSGRYDDTNPSDVAEYHAVRDGVDEQAVSELLNDRSLWACRTDALLVAAGAGAAMDRERTSLHDTFALVASERREDAWTRKSETNGLYPSSGRTGGPVGAGIMSAWSLTARCPRRIRPRAARPDAGERRGRGARPAPLPITVPVM